MKKTELILANLIKLTKEREIVCNCDCIDLTHTENGKEIEL